jgi:Mn2+/Fe2+ NRAMP family transporter
VFVLLGGYGAFEKLMKVLVGVMGLAILTCALLTFSEPVASVRGMLVPVVPPGGAMYVLALIGGIGGSITLLSYNYWMREEGLTGGEQLGYVRGDVGVAYTFTALFGVCIALIANQAFFVTGTTLTDAQAVSGMAEMLGRILGPFGHWAYAVGFWAAVSASLLGVWQSVPYMYADIYGILKKLPPAERERVTRVTSTPYRVALLFVTLVPIPFAFTGRPIGIIIVYTVVGSLFVPFLAATLLYLNNRVRWSGAVPHNGWASNVLMWVILALFAAIGVREMLDTLG